MQTKIVSILGTRGIPSNHGGFETFAQDLGLYLSERGWTVNVYCQKIGKGKTEIEIWKGIQLIKIYIKKDTNYGTLLFDLKSIIHSLRNKGIFLTLGYNTAILNLIYKVFRKVNIINMDGIEWKRRKWGFFIKSWFWINEKLALLFSKHIVADHPEIKTHLAKFISKNKISMIPYGAEFIQKANADCLKKFKIEKFKYSLIIARPEPENSVFEIIKAFSNKHRNQKLVVLGKYDFKQNLYHKKIKETASKEVYFIGPVYNRDIVSSLRYFSRLYFHGHQVGGTNPSLVESLAAQNTIVCNDNKYNRWVSGDGALYFSDIKSLINILNNIDKVDLDQLRINALDRYNKLFKNEIVLNNYEKLLLHFV